MNKQTLRDCIFDGLNQLEKMNSDTPVLFDKPGETLFSAMFLAGWIKASIKYKTVEIRELKEELCE